MTDEEAVRITLAYFNPRERLPLRMVATTDSKDPDTPLDEVERENKREATRAWRAVRQAVARRLVSVIKCPRIAYNHNLAASLREAFPTLLGAQVVDLEALNNIADARVKDDRIHEELGQAAATWIGDGMLFQDKSAIGCGSGRGVFHTVSYLSSLAPLGARDVTVMSLTGWMQAKSHTGKGRDLEADAHTALMVACFNNQIAAQPLAIPLVHADQATRDKVRERTQLGTTSWSRLHPRYALLGVGVLGTGHRLYDAGCIEDHDTRLQPIVHQLKELVGLIDEVRKGSRCALYYPVADIANHW